MRYRALPLISAVLAAAAAGAFACSFIPENLNILQRKAKHRGTYHAVLVKTTLGQSCGTQARLLHLQVKRAFGPGAASPGDTVTLATQTSSAACGVDYPLGSELVLFADIFGRCDETPAHLWTMQ